jgi:hypothetical protein
MEKWCDIAAALLALVAAVFWFLSAYGELPAVAMYWGHAPESDPFYQAVKFSATMNRWVSVVSGSAGQFPKSLLEFQGRFATEGACARSTSSSAVGQKGLSARVAAGVGLGC